MNRHKVLIIALLLAASLAACGKAAGPEMRSENVTIKNRGTYFEVTLDFGSGASHREVGKELGVKILETVPEYEASLDSYLSEISKDNNTYNLFMKRVKDIKPQLDKEYRDEIEGMASSFSGQEKNIRGDGKLSEDEVYLVNLCPDIARLTQCSALGVYGDRSESGQDISMRILDWFAGSQNQLSRYHAVSRFKNSDKSISTIGYLGYMGCISGFNDDKVFGAILDSPTKEEYSSKQKMSYPFDLRHALENTSTLDSAASFLKSPDRNYTYGHLIFFSDPNSSKVLENNISGKEESLRELRTDKSRLNDGIEWNISDSVGCVNSFLLKGNMDNHSVSLSNTARLDSMKKVLQGKGNRISQEEMKELASYYTGDSPGLQENGSLYNIKTQQIIVFEPGKDDYRVFFRPAKGEPPLKPAFEKISASFGN